MERKVSLNVASLSESERNLSDLVARSAVNRSGL